MPPVVARLSLEPHPMASPEPLPPSKPWSVLAYLVADDHSSGMNLDNLAKKELVELCQAASAAQFTHLSLATQVDFEFQPGVFRASINPPPSRGFEAVPPDRLWRKILKLLPRQQQDDLKLQKDADDLNAARGGVLEAFLRYGRTECPAERQLLYFYGHASGPMGLFYDGDGKRPPNTLRLYELADAIRRGLDGRPVAVVMFRDCWMNTLEAACELQSVAEFMIASQSLVPGEGQWPWAGFVEAMASDDSTDAHATALADTLIAYLEPPANRAPFADAPISLLDLRVASAVTDPLKRLTAALVATRASGPSAALAVCAAALDAARGGVPNDNARPGDPTLVDVLTMCEGLATGPAAVADAARDLAAAVRAVVKRHRSQAPDSPYRGVSLYYQTLPGDDRSYIQAGDEVAAAADAKDYKRLMLVQDTGWWQIALDPLPLAP